MKGEPLPNLPLPPGVQVQVDLVDKDDRRLVQRVPAFRIMREQPPPDIDNPRHHRLVAETELAEANFAIRSADVDARLA